MEEHSSASSTEIHSCPQLSVLSSNPSCEDWVAASVLDFDLSLLDPSFTGSFATYVEFALFVLLRDSI